MPVKRMKFLDRSIERTDEWTDRRMGQRTKRWSDEATNQPTQKRTESGNEESPAPALSNEIREPYDLRHRDIRSFLRRCHNRFCICPRERADERDTGRAGKNKWQLTFLSHLTASRRGITERREKEEGERDGKRVGGREGSEEMPRSLRMGPVARGEKVDDRGGKEGGQGRRAENRARAFLGALPAKSSKVRLVLLPPEKCHVRARNRARNSWNSWIARSSQLSSLSLSILRYWPNIDTFTSNTLVSILFRGTKSNGVIVIYCWINIFRMTEKGKEREMDNCYSL